MNYSDLINSHLKYGTTEENIKIRKGYEKIQENVVIAPWWSHDIFDNMNFKIEQVSEKVYNFYKDDLSFSYIELKSIGAPGIMDFILSLGVTKCKNLVFLGSAGSIFISSKYKYVNTSAADKEPPGCPAFAECTDVTIPLRTSLAIFFNSITSIFTSYVHFSMALIINQATSTIPHPPPN